MKKKVIFVYGNLGIGGISKSLIDVLKILDYEKCDVTLYIRRDDVLDLIHDVPDEVKIKTITNKVKKRQFNAGITGKLEKLIYSKLIVRHKHLAKTFITFCLSSEQRRREALTPEINETEYDMAICYSTDGDDPVFVYRYVKEKKNMSLFIKVLTLVRKVLRQCVNMMA